MEGVLTGFAAKATVGDLGKVGIGVMEIGEVSGSEVAVTRGVVG